MHTLFYKELYRDFENVEFILIKRNLCANVQSIAFTKWIPLNIDGLPSFISNNKGVRYFFATMLLYKYWKTQQELEKHPACKLSIQYEDIILEKVNNYIISLNLNIPILISILLISALTFSICLIAATMLRLIPKSRFFLG